ncbi:DUF3291 domain-containing protein [Lewinella sp. W8]|uniref:DUF3291 domain-containing protein n=1 Tax=Lewinella sp. W8 TaxID=2528208 RepID=UPI0010688C9C|nr:DUF3291 domain-containing protein [Lewinella sp. W8]MTB49666.1 DUF3291 domain-containing protein [Lewinella sp. W8]
MRHVTTLSLIRYTGLRQKSWAFAQMGLAPTLLSKVSGLSFGRLMGSGGGNGFSLAPNFGVYAWLGHWEDRDAAEDFFAHHDWWQEVRQRQDESATFFMLPTMTHGVWGGERPFTPDPEAYDPASPVAVITRATIRTRKLPDFWRYVPQTSASVEEHADRVLSVGIGEYPIFMQATFSIWRSGKSMQDFAYRSKHHKQVVRLTRDRKWYKEEMFTRFSLLEARGKWNGQLATELC